MVCCLVDYCHVVCCRVDNYPLSCHLNDYNCPAFCYLVHYFFLLSCLACPAVFFMDGYCPVVVFCR